MSKRVIIDCFPESARRYGPGWTVVAVDVIRATTSMVTLAALGRQCYAVGSLEAARDLASRLDDPLLVGELGGDMPEGFHMNNSPVELAALGDQDRPVVLLSTSGTRLVHEARHADAVYLACFRNFSFTADYLAGRHERIAVIGAGSRGEFREEDQMGCAWVAERLMAHGYAAGISTREIVDRWHGVAPSACADGHSANYLKRTGQAQDLDFVLHHIDDYQAAVTVRGQAVMVVAQAEPAVFAPAGVGALAQREASALGD